MTSASKRGERPVMDNKIPPAPVEDIKRCA